MTFTSSATKNSSRPRLQYSDLNESLNSWGDSTHGFIKYQDLGWPIETPEYLLSGYFRLLHSAGNVSRMTSCGTDHARHERLLEMSGSDTASLAEIVTAQEALLTAHRPDLIAMSRLAVHRKFLQNRNHTIPACLPAAWASIGCTDRGEALAHSITDVYARTLSINGLIGTITAAGGDRERALRLITEAEATALSIKDPGLKERALVGLVSVVAGAGDFARAEALAHTIMNQERRAEALVSLVSTVAASGDIDGAETLALTVTGWRAGLALKDVALAAASNGDSDRAAAVALKTSGMQAMDTLGDLVPVIALKSGFECAENLARLIGDPGRRALAFCNLGSVAAAPELQDTRDPVRSVPVAGSALDLPNHIQ
jgi:hypothetical protein